MGQLKTHVGWGIALIGFGGLLLLKTVGVVIFPEAWLWAATFGIASLILLGALARGQTRNWLTFIGYMAAAAATVIALEETHLRVVSRYSGQMVATAFGLGFLALYVSARRRWWAMLVGGIFLSLAAATTVEEMLRGLNDLPPAIFALGLGATFGLLYFLPNEREQPMRWALFTAIALVAIGFIAATAAVSMLNAFWALVLIGVGLYLLLRHRSQEPAR